MSTQDHAFLQILQSCEKLRYILLPDMTEDCEVGRTVFCILTFEPYANWMYPKKVDKCVRIRDKKKQKGKTHMPNKNSPTKYSEEFKKTIVTLYQSGKTYAEIKKEYGVSSSALSNWVRKYSQVQVDEDTVLTAQQIKALQRRNAELEEENLILKKAIAIFTPHSDRD